MFFSEIEKIIRKTAEIIKEKANNLLNNPNLTKQQLIMNGLMNKYIEVIINQCAKQIMYPELIKHAIETFDEKETIFVFYNQNSCLESL